MKSYKDYTKRDKYNLIFECLHPEGNLHNIISEHTNYQARLKGDGFGNLLKCTIGEGVNSKILCWDHIGKSSRDGIDNISKYLYNKLFIEQFDKLSEFDNLLENDLMDRSANFSEGDFCND